MAGHPHTAEQEPEYYDVLGVGFGPTNIALAIAIEERNAQTTEPERLRAGFVEAQPRFGWHRGMLLDGATMQVSYLKDLVTMRNPASDYSFLNYLHGCGRLVDFINHKTFFPLRHEFHDYLEWAAGRLSHLVAYGQTVTALAPVLENGELVAVDVLARDSGGAVTVRRARHVVVALGLEPTVPAGIALDDRVWHNSDFLDRVAAMPTRPHGRFLVIGAGQSGAEVTDYLHREFPTAEVHAVFARYGYTPADNSPFANQIFDPDAVDTFVRASADVRKMLDGYHRSTNYSVVDLDFLEDLYHRAYQEKVRGPQRLHLHRVSRLTGVKRLPDGVRVGIEFLPTGQTETIDVDVAVFATGYKARRPERLFEGFGGLFRTDGEGRFQVTRDYQVMADGPASAGIYVPGATEHVHGISSTLLSNVAVRAGEILSSVLARPTGSARPAAAEEALSAAVAG